MQHIFIRLLLALLCLLPFSASATPQSIHVEWGYTPPSEPAVIGYNLYQEGVFVCKTDTPTATTMDCSVDLATATTNFTLTATFSDGTESPHSAPFAFTLSDSPDPLQAETDTTPVVKPPPPTAIISTVTTASGSAPLTVNFDASDSKAASGATIASYSWNFGDGSPTTTGVSVTASHTFTVGTFSTTLTVTDSNGLTSSISTPVVVNAVTSDTILVPDVQDGTDPATTDPVITTPTSPPEEQHATSMKIEMGEIDVDGDWGHVDLDLSNFQNPVVIVGPAGSNDAAPGVIRLRNVDATGFDIKFAEWNNLDDGKHLEETVSYIVMEKGRTTLPDGSIVEAGTFNGATTNQNIKFSAPFNKIPVVVTTVASENETDTISGRLSKITTSSFAYYFKEQEINKNVHVKETVNFIAWEPGMGMIGMLRFEVANTAAGLTDAWSLVPFQQTFQQPPLFLADMQTNNNTDTCTLRVRGAAATGAPVKVEEEQSNDLETTHPEETVGYILLNQED